MLIVFLSKRFENLIRKHRIKNPMDFIKIIFIYPYCLRNIAILNRGHPKTTSRNFHFLTTLSSRFLVLRLQCCRHKSLDNPSTLRPWRHIWTTPWQISFLFQIHNCLNFIVMSFILSFEVRHLFDLSISIIIIVMKFANFNEKHLRIQI